MIILVGASASGKTEAAKELNRLFSLKKAVTTTTRKMREGEKDGVDYFFVSKDEFEKRKEKNEFVETASYAGNFYGCGKDQVARDKVLIVEPNGLHAFLALNDKSIVSFFINVSDKIREKRMTLRGDKPNDIKTRLESDKSHFSLERIGKIDHIIDGDNMSIKEVAETIYKLYRQTLKERD